MTRDKIVGDSRETVHPQTGSTGCALSFNVICHSCSVLNNCRERPSALSGTGRRLESGLTTTRGASGILLSVDKVEESSFRTLSDATSVSGMGEALPMMAASKATATMENFILKVGFEGG